MEMEEVDRIAGIGARLFNNLEVDASSTVVRVTVLAACLWYTHGTEVFGQEECVYRPG
jgi:hypothetical protein